MLLGFFKNFLFSEKIIIYTFFSLKIFIQWYFFIDLFWNIYSGHSFSSNENLLMMIPHPAKKQWFAMFNTKTLQETQNSRKIKVKHTFLILLPFSFFLFPVLHEFLSFLLELLFLHVLFAELLPSLLLELFHLLSFLFPLCFV